MQAMKEYNGEKMRVIRAFKYGKDQFVDLRDQSGKDYKGVPVEDLGKKKVLRVQKNTRKISFKKDNKENVFEDGSSEYKQFITDNKLSKVMIENCIKGVTKTHKGYVITEVK